MSRLSTVVVLALVAVAPLAALGAHRLARRLLRVPGLGLFTFYPAEPARAASRAARLGVRAAGPAALYLYAAVLVLVGLLLGGTSVGTTRVDVLDGPARAAGVRDGDRVVAVDGSPVDDFGEIRRLVAARGGRPVAVRLERDGREETVTVAPDARGLLGIRSRQERRPMPIGAAVRHAATRPALVIMSVWTRYLRDLSRHREVAGPVAVVRMMPQVSLAAAVVYAGDLCGYAWWAYLVVVVVATVVGEGRARGRLATTPRGSP